MGFSDEPPAPETPRFPPFSVEMDPQVEALGVKPHFFTVRGLPRLGVNAKGRVQIADEAMAGRYKAWRDRQAEQIRTGVCNLSTAAARRFFRVSDELSAAQRPLLEDASFRAAYGTLRARQLEMGVSKPVDENPVLEFAPSPAQLWEFASRNKGQVPKVHPLVDAYNAVSLETGLALGAHNITAPPMETFEDVGGGPSPIRAPHIEGPLRLRMTNGSESFTPLSRGYEVQLPGGLYAYVDDGWVGQDLSGQGRVLCMLVAEQVHHSRITPETEDAFFIVQGGQNAQAEDLSAAQRQVEQHMREIYGEGAELQFDTVETAQYSG